MNDDALIRWLYGGVRDGIADLAAARLATSKLILRALHGEHLQPSPTVQTHPLGFCAVRWGLEDGQALRIHIWSSRFQWEQTPFWPVHDHVFDFSSVVLEGRVVNKLYALQSTDRNDRGACGVYEVDYTGTTSTVRLVRAGVTLKVSSVTCVQASESYRMNAGELHRSKLASEVAVTVLATQDRAGIRRPRVIGDGEVDQLTFQRTSGWSSDVSKQVRDIAISLERPSV